MLRKMILIAVALAALAGGAAQTARAADSGVLYPPTTRFYSSYVRYHFSFDVLADPLTCSPDTYGFYETTGCDDAVANNATLDVHVYKLRWHRSPVLRYAEEFDGQGGQAAEQLWYFVDLGAPYNARRGAVVNFKAVFRLFDPVTDRVLDRDTEIFHLSYR